MGMSEQIQNQQQQAEKWFKELRNQMVGAIQKVDGSTFQEKEWRKYNRLISSFVSDVLCAIDKGLKKQ